MLIIRAGILVITAAISRVADRLDGAFGLISIRAPGSGPFRGYARSSGMPRRNHYAHGYSMSHPS